MAFFNCMMQNSTTCIVLFKSRGFLLKQELYYARVATSTRVNQRRAPFWAWLVNFGTTSSYKTSYNFKFTLDSCAIKRSQALVIRQINFDRLGKMSNDRCFDQQRENIFMSVNAANQERGLTVLILLICINTTSNQKFHHGFSVAAAGEMEGCCEVWIS